MNKDNPFTTIGDEALEARIVSWVLGEASAFEAAELERLCEERPELMIFRRRMAALNGLLNEASSRSDDDNWKLPPSKRDPLVNLLDPAPALTDPHKEIRIRHSAMRSILSIAACLMLTVIILGLTAPMMIRQRKKAEMSPAQAMARQRELAALEDEMDSVVTHEEMKALRTDIPAERIEGTPKPVILEENSSRRYRANSDRQTERTDAFAADEKKVQTGKESKPSAPASSMARVASSAANSATSIPVPQADVATSSLDFGDGRSFGGGGGEASGGAGGGVAKAPAARPAPAEEAILPSPRGMITDSRQGGLKNDLSILNNNTAAADDNRDTSKVAEATVTEYTLSSGYKSEYLFLGKDLSESGAHQGGRWDEQTISGNTDSLAKRKEASPAPGAVALRDWEAADAPSSGKGSSDPATTSSLSVAEKREGATERGELNGVASHPADKSQIGNFFYDSGALPSNPAQVAPQMGGAAKENKQLEQAEGNVQLGGLEDAKRGYEDVLRSDPDKAGARERLLAEEVAKALEQAEADKAGESVNVHGKLAQREMIRRQANKPSEPKKAEAPRPDLTKLMEEISAAEEPYSTFSLNISDASFRIAQAALAKGERPHPAGVKVEQFYNAVNYGDPAPAAGEPVACFLEQSAHPVIPGRNLVRVALKTAAAGRSAAQPLRLTLLVDQSGSMSRADRRDAMDAAMRSLGSLLTANDQVTVIGFSRTSRLLADGMKGDEIAQKLPGLVNQAASEGGTNLEMAIKLAEQKAVSRKLQGAQNRIVLFTDGAANLGDADPQRLAAKVEQLRQQGIAFDIAGIAADDLNDELLAELARKGNGRYSVVGKGEEQDFAKQLAGAFRPAAENVKVQVRFNPERVKSYKLIGFEKDRLKTEDFRNDAVDAAELAAEEAGVAIYQVEPIPDGRGEIGEVSVRFRDTARGEMVERMWTMTHNAATPAVDRAAPSMQLAVLSMLAAEKLKGGPLADAIDFKQFAESQAVVKQAFANDTRIADMLRMIDALK